MMANYILKQPYIGVLIKRCSENISQLNFKKFPMVKFSKFPKYPNFRNKISQISPCNFQKQPLQMFFIKISVLKNFAIFTRKHLCWYFTMNIAKFLKTALFIEHFWWLLLQTTQRRIQGCCKIQDGALYDIVNGFQSAPSWMLQQPQIRLCYYTVCSVLSFKSLVI